ncbi:MAG: HAMP domain-containing protein [Pseudomonadota bacterium]
MIGSQKSTRSIFIINRTFQIKYALLLAVMGGLVALLFAAHIFYFCNEYFKIFVPNYASNPSIVSFLHEEHMKIAVYLLLLIMFMMIFLFFLGIVITHKIAGPIMVVKRKMKDIISGDLSARARLRKGDEFRDLADSFNNLADILEKKHNKVTK